MKVVAGERPFLAAQRHQPWVTSRASVALDQFPGLIVATLVGGDGLEPPTLSV